MTKKGYKKIWIERECYEKLEKRARDLGLTVGEYATKLVEKLVQTPIEEVLKLLHQGGISMEVELVEVKVKIPRQVYEFMEAAYSFAKTEESFEEGLGRPIVWQNDACLHSQFEGLTDAEDVGKKHGLTPEILDC